MYLILLIFNRWVTLQVFKNLMITTYILVLAILKEYKKKTDHNLFK